LKFNAILLRLKTAESEGLMKAVDETQKRWTRHECDCDLYRGHIPDFKCRKCGGGGFFLKSPDGKVYPGWAASDGPVYDQTIRF
jgi:hypothetical protein